MNDSQKPVKRDFKNVSTWIFDLDNTLYPPESYLWPQVDERITRYLADFFGIDGQSSRLLQKYYYQRYGTTLSGLMDHYVIDPHHFLDFAHRIDYGNLMPNPSLKEALEHLKGRKFILTNGSLEHANHVSEKLGIRTYFDGVFSITDAEFVPKPDRSVYERFLDRYSVEPTGAAMFEDIAKNLIIPSDMGMTTVLVLPQTVDPFRELHEQSPVDEPHVHYITRDLPTFLQDVAMSSPKKTDSQ